MILQRIALRLTRWSERFVPSAFSIACLLTLATFLFGVFLARKSFFQCVGYWGDGFWTLLDFGMQMCLVMMTGAILAGAPLFKRILDAFTSLAKTPKSAVLWMAFASLALAWLHWGLGLVASAILVRGFARRHPGVDFRVLTAAAYFGMGAIWHAGLSGSAPLLVATPNHFMEAQIGLIPLTQTLFTPFNLGLSAVTVLALLLLARWYYPSNPKDVWTVSPEVLKNFEESDAVHQKPQARTWAEKVEHTYVLNFLLGALGLLWAFQTLRSGNFHLTLNTLNFLFLSLAFLAHPSPAAFVKAGEEAVTFVHGVILQFPLYAGMYGIIKGSGLDQIIAEGFIGLADSRNFPFIIYWYSGILNYFVPSGGSKWAIEAPYILEAAKVLHVPYSKVVLAYAWGDMVTDMIQPFWCIPILTVARIEFKEILGYCAIAFLVCSLIGSLAFLLIL
ncbi:MAG: short-chain fatty acid transporter [Armatimonadetes bacterium]|nr:short-chain fatty acid transporter [Armatimonadota bacterium]